MEQPSANCEMQKAMDQFVMHYGNMAAEFTGVSQTCKELVPMFAKMIEAVVEEQANRMEKIVDAKIAEAISCMTPVQANWLVVPVLLFIMYKLDFESPTVLILINI